MVILLEREPSAFDPEKFPEWVWVSSLFGRLTHNLVLRDELKRAYEIVEREMQVVADIQRSLLPQELPAIPRLELGAHYQTSRWAGGDYYDFFPLPDGRWGILIADVSGHGTPGGRDDGDHAQPGPRTARASRAAGRAPGARQPAVVPPVRGRQRGVRHGVLRHLRPGGADPLLRLRRAQSAAAEAVRRVRPSSRSTRSAVPRWGSSTRPNTTRRPCRSRPTTPSAFYTDGITEAMDARGVQFGTERLDEVLGRCDLDAPGIVRAVVEAVDAFTGGHPPEDDRTLLVAIVG